ncbi:MAG TPA: nucleoside recognition domain-containing protein [Spirochaetia bacterium]|nr:nucleoside recognition domain-containing protein [Spirochaetia bacterium]
MKVQRSLVEGIVSILVLVLVFGFMGSVMGAENLINTIMRTAYDLLINTVLYLVAVTVIVGAFSSFLVEFGAVRIVERLLSPLMKPLFRLPGVASLGALLCFLSDNPAILSLAKDKGYRSYFKKYQLYSLTNFGTAFGMGLIVITYMIGQGHLNPSGGNFYAPALIGLGGAVFGSIVSTRLMQLSLRKTFGEEEAVPAAEQEGFDEARVMARKEEGLFIRFLNAVLDGGKSGLEAGVAIVPGVLVISTAVMMLTWGPKDAALGYQGLAYEGVPVFPAIGRALGFLFNLLFGFTSPEAIAFPITSLGAVGAALGLVPRLLKEGLVGPNDIAVFTAIGMCWSGFLSTHTGMMDALGRRDLIGKAIGAHAVGGLAAGVFAHYLFLAFRALGA